MRDVLDLVCGEAVREIGRLHRQNKALKRLLSAVACAVLLLAALLWAIVPG